MEQSERDMLIALDAKMNNVCGSITDLAARLETQYATKDYVELRIQQQDAQPKSDWVRVFSSKPVIIAITIIISLAILGASDMFGGMSDSEEQEIKDYIEQQAAKVGK